MNCDPPVGEHRRSGAGNRSAPIGCQGPLVRSCHPNPAEGGERTGTRSAGSSPKRPRTLPWDRLRSQFGGAGAAKRASMSGEDFVPSFFFLVDERVD
jgi:hypothetical protein